MNNQIKIIWVLYRICSTDVVTEIEDGRNYSDKINYLDKVDEFELEELAISHLSSMSCYGYSYTILKEYRL